MNAVTNNPVGQNAIVSFTDKKNVSHELTFEAALHKGGAALTAVKDMALDMALSKAVNGKYRAAAEIIGGAFPATNKAYAKLFKALPWGNKQEFAAYLAVMERAEGGKNGFTAKQVTARQLMSALRNLPALAKVATESDVVEMEVTA